MKRTVLLASLVCLCLFVAAGNSSAAATLTTLHVFDDTDGNGPMTPLVQGTNGNFYGTTPYGGTDSNDCIGGCGTVFEISAGGAFMSLHSFTNYDGSDPRTPLVQGRDGNLYGTTFDPASLFRLTASGDLTNLFPGVGSPDGELIQGSDGVLYGTVQGAVFGVTTDGVVTIQAQVILTVVGVTQGSDGYLYGTTQYGGTSTNCYAGCGTVFRCTTDGVVTTLHSFDGSDGSAPLAGVVQGLDGNLYGTTSGGLASFTCSNNGCGTVFMITTNGDLTTLHSFSGPDGKQPRAALVQGSDGNFYGTTFAGGVFGPGFPGIGTVFQITTNGVLTSLHTFTALDGGGPWAALVQGSDGSFYGTTEVGGTNDCSCGTVFKLTVMTNGAATVGCTLSPTLATNTVGTTHTVTATVTSNGTAKAGILVNFSVSGANLGHTGTATTSASGQGSFTYTGTTVGTDTIRAIAGTATGTATKVWIPAGPNQPPVAVCKTVTTSANATCQANLVAADFDGGSIDNDGTITSRVISPTGPFDKGVQQVILTVTDNNGASSSCTTTVTVVDQTVPVIQCPGNIVTNVGTVATNAVVNFTVPASDNCGAVSTNCAPPSGSTFPLGTNAVTCTAVDEAGNTNSCNFNVVVLANPPVPHDFAVISIKPPKKITLSTTKPSLTKPVKIQIQNLGTQTETIPDANTLLQLVALNIESLGACPVPATSLVPPKSGFPLALAPNKKLNLAVNVTFNCANDPLASSKTDDHSDFRYTVTVNPSALDGNPDVVAANNGCPRLPSGTDKGCGGKTSTGSLGGDVKTDVVEK